MFTNQRDILPILRLLGFTPTHLNFIPRGVMTDKYKFSHDGIDYIVRCFQSYRKDQPELEFEYLTMFQERGIKAPKPIAVSCDDSMPFIIYEMLEGRPLSDCYSVMDSKQKDAVCQEIADNYLKISEIQCQGYGRIQEFDKFSDDSWSGFIQKVIVNAETMAEKQGDVSMKRCCQRMRRFALDIPEPSPNLIWSDLSNDNIIINEYGKLEGFIDFEGLLSGDPILGIGYLGAHEKEEDFVSRLTKAFRIPTDSNLVDFYSLIRWCRLMPYQHLPLMNKDSRKPLKEFLPNAYSLIQTFNKS